MKYFPWVKNIFFYPIVIRRNPRYVREEDFRLG